MTENINNNSDYKIITIQDINLLEKRFSKIPEDYKSFLLKNMLSTYSGKFFYINNYPYGEYWGLEYFYGTKSDRLSTIGGVYDIEWAEVDDFISIGEGIGAPQICMDLRPKTKGHIYFYDTEGFDGQKFEEMIYKIANSFTEFIENLKDESEMPEL